MTIKMDDKLKEELAYNRELLDDFMKENDIKRLVATYFMMAHKANGFPGLKHDDLLDTRFPFGNYDFRLLRLPRIAKPTRDQAIVAGVLKHSEQVLNRQNEFENTVKRNKIRIKEHNKAKKDREQL